MSSSLQIRQKIAEVARKRAEVERHLGAAQSQHSKKTSEAYARQQSAAKSTSDSSRRSYERQAQGAFGEAARESTKISDLHKAIAGLAKEHASLQQSLLAAEKTEADTARRADDKRRRDQDTSDRKLAQRRAAEERRRFNEHAADQRRANERHAATVSLITSTGDRLHAEIADVRAPRQEQLRILYATASADPTRPLRVDQEMRRVTAAVTASTHRDLVEIRHLPAATAGDLLDNLHSFRPHVVHFSGHADQTAITLDTGEDDWPRSGLAVKGTPLLARHFKAVMEACDEPPILVVLNACDSAAQLDALVGRILLAVGMNDSVGDVDAIVFATRFYRALAEGQSIAAALDSAKIEMELSGLEGHDLPTLVCVEGIDPAQVRLVVPAAT